MTEQTIQSQDIKVADVFQAFYAVPDYQREYVWETDQVEQLLSDINNELGGSNPQGAPEYFIGSIVVCPGREGVLELIDGQQRMTTLFILLCAIRDRAKELGESPPGALEPQISAISTDASGTDRFRYRLDLQYEDSGDVLVRIAKGDGKDVPEPSTRSITNILNAYKVCRGFLVRECGSDIAVIRSFYGYLSNKVKMIRIQTEDVARALKIFETINDRGVGLDSVDLLKNLLFMKADLTKFDKLKDLWKTLQDTIFEAGEKPLRFLRYFIFSHYDLDADVLREDEIYDWLRKHEHLCGYGTDPVGFAMNLVRAARLYKNFLDGNGPSGHKSRYLENLQLLGRKAARQHLILLLAGLHLNDLLFERLAHEVEDLFFVYVITREPTRDFERNFARWAGEIRKVGDETGLQTIVDNRFVPAKAELSARFDDAFARMDANSIQQYRLRYVLAKLTQWLELQAYGEAEGTKWLSRFTGAGFEIEHIFPQQPGDDAFAEFGTYEDPNIIYRLGNLTLVEKSINASLGRKPYSQKRLIYPQSQLLLTRVLAGHPNIGVNTKIDQAVANFKSYASWDEKAVSERQVELAALARLAWNVPGPTG